MTRDEVLAMRPGRELDVLVAEKVMGYEISELWPGCVKEKGRNKVFPMPRYSTDISAAFEVFEYFTKLGCWVEVRYNNRKNTYGALIVKDGREIYGEVSWKDDIKTAPEAICKAALLAVMDG